MLSTSVLKKKPITHNGKEYYPDANGWYDIECTLKDGIAILISSTKGEIEYAFYDDMWMYANISDYVKFKPTKWKPIKPPEEV